jgi:hypothetical protein
MGLWLLLLNRSNAIADQRPWLAISDMQFAQPFSFEAAGASAGFKFNVKNLGKSPALNVFTYLKLGARRSSGGGTILDERNAFRDEFLARGHPGYAVAIFPMKSSLMKSLQTSYSKRSTSVRSGGAPTGSSLQLFGLGSFMSRRTVSAITP